MLGLSLIINGLCPFLLYRVLGSHFPAGTVMPLLYASMFPALGSILGIVRKGTVDVIAMIVMAALAMHIVVTLIARNVGITLVAISLDGTLVGLVLIVSAMVRRPIILIAAKQLAVDAGPERATALNRVIENTGKRAFSTITIVWGLALLVMSGSHIVLALNLPPADFLLLSPIVGVIEVAPIAWTLRLGGHWPRFEEQALLDATVLEWLKRN